VKLCAHGHSVATLLNPRGVVKASHKDSLTVARYSNVAVAVHSTVNSSANYKIKILFQIQFKHVNKLSTLIIYYKLLKVPSIEKQSYYAFRFVNESICIEIDSSGSKSSYGPVLHSYI
jgi:hypothetical protein